MKRRLLLALAAALMAAPAFAAPEPYIAQALADPARASQAGQDAQRKPGDILAFAGVKPGDKVVDLIPGGGYFTRLFSKIVGPKGRVYALWPNEYLAEERSGADNSRKLAEDPAFPNLTVLVQPAAAFTAPEPVDLVFTSQNYHDYPDKFMGKVDPVAFDRQVYAALKPGGVFLIVDHAAQTGSGLRDTDTLHRIDPEIVKAELKEAGFVFAGESPALGNPADDHTKLVFDPAIRGHTDQFVFKFVKPGARR